MKIIEELEMIRAEMKEELKEYKEEAKHTNDNSIMLSIEYYKQTIKNLTKKIYYYRRKERK